MCPNKRPGKERKGDGESITIAGTEDQYVTNTVTTIRAHETAFVPTITFREHFIIAVVPQLYINHGMLAHFVMELISPIYEMTTS